MSKYDLIRYGLTVIELLACITGFIYWKKLKGTFWRWFPVYLLVIVVIEIAAPYLDDSLNNNLYRFFGIPIQFLFFCWLFYRYFENLRESKWAIAGVIVYVLAWFTEMFFLTSKQLWFFSFSYTVGNVILAILVLSFFRRFINSERILGYRSDMMFWVCLGLLIFYLGSLPYFGLYNTIKDSKRYPGLLNTYWMFQMAFDCLMYIFFIISFIWGKPR